jgi:hypothetical protein
VVSGVGMEMLTSLFCMNKAKQVVTKSGVYSMALMDYFSCLFWKPILNSVHIFNSEEQFKEWM